MAEALIALYRVLALAAIGRAIVQLSLHASQAPFAYALTAVAGIVYAAGTVLVRRPGAARAAQLVFGGELLAVLTVGTITTVAPRAFGDDTVWTHYGLGYALLPLILPIAALWFVHRRGPAADQPT